MVSLDSLASSAVPRTNRLRREASVSFAVGLGAVAAAAVLAQGSLGVTEIYPIKAAGVFAAIAAVSLAFLEPHHPFQRLGPANHVTSLRAGITALVAGLIGEGTPAVGTAAIVALMLAVAILDGVDGWLARRSGMASAFGARFDMEVDALLILVLSLLAWQYGKAGPWIVLCGSMRYLFVAAGLLLPWMRRPLPFSRRRQAICIVQIAGLTLAVAPAVAPPASALAGAAALAALSYSFAVDTHWLWRRLA